MKADPTPPDLSSYLADIPRQEAAIGALFSHRQALTFFDIGACEGEDSIRYSRRFPRARIFAFEPLPSNQALVRVNFAKYDILNRAELIGCALSNNIGTATFHVSSGVPSDRFAGENWNYGNKSSSLLTPAITEGMHGWINFREVITVPTTTLAHFCQDRKINHIDFIHLDAQGAELLVLEGAGAMLQATTAVWLEVADSTFYQGQPLRDEIRRFMHSQGFMFGFESSQHSEGDQFYVNRRQPRAWVWLCRHRLVKHLRKARFIAGRWKSSLRRLITRS